MKNMKFMKLFIVFAFILALSSFCSTAYMSEDCPANVIYIVDDAPDTCNNRAEVISTLESMNFVVDVVTNNDLPYVNWDNYDLIVIGDDWLSNYNLIPLYDIPTMIMNFNHIADWNLVASNIPVGYTGSSIKLRMDVALDTHFIIEGYEDTSVYTYDQTSDCQSKTIVVHHFKRAAATADLITLTTLYGYNTNVEISAYDIGSTLKNGYTANARIVMFGPFDATYWSDESKLFFERGIIWLTEFVDSDSDGIPDWDDNCPCIINSGQEDSDSDGRGDVCDNCVDVPNFDQSNIDQDDFGDACDSCVETEGYWCNGCPEPTCGQCKYPFCPEEGAPYCANVDDGIVCNDEQFCTVDDQCVSGICEGSARDVDDGISCTDDSCDEINDTIINTPNNAYCDNGLVCDGEEYCDAVLDCQNGQPIDCSQNDITEIGTCFNSPDDDFDLTWDHRNAFTSECVEDPTGAPGYYCTTGDETIYNECDIDNCNAECVVDLDCENVTKCTSTNKTYTVVDCADCTCEGRTGTWQCIKGSCGAECSDDSDCADTECDDLDNCYDGTYRDYNDVANDCVTNCACEDNSCTDYTEIITDNDQDGYDTECDGDCDDSNPDVNPGATEICDNDIDEDCDGQLNNGCTCDPILVGSECVSEGYIEKFYEWNWNFCGEPYSEILEDPACNCNYTEWTDDQCVDDGYMRQTRTETSGYEYCDDPLEQNVPDPVCDCQDSEDGRICIDDGFANVTYSWNYGYCGDSYSQSEADANCACNYTEWTDDACISDGYMSQYRDELSGLPYCTDPLEQNIPDPACDCNDFETGRVCVDNGTAEVSYSWNYDYCGGNYAQNETDASCNCDDSETGRICIDDGVAQVTYNWNFGYCGSEYTIDVADPTCACNYTTWEDDQCVEDGYMRQTRDELSGLPYCNDPLEQEIPNPVCDCSDYEIDRQCHSDGYASVTYTWNYDYCGQDYTQKELDPYCGCDYTEWTDDTCVDDGVMSQYRDELSGLPYCDDPLEQNVTDPICDCSDYEISRECISDGFANVTYTWNYGYCGDDYSQTEADANCACDYSEWQDDICIDDGYMRQTRDELSGLPYCTDPLEQNIPDPACDCNDFETGRICIDNGTAEVSYSWNYDYCGQDYTQNETDASCDCEFTETGRVCVSDGYADVNYEWNFAYCGQPFTECEADANCACNYTEWTDDACISDGYMRQTRDELSGLPYCNDTLEQEIPNPVCDCESYESGRACIADGTAEVTYTWNHAYCGDDYTETAEDPSCNCNYTEWESAGCVADGIMSYTRNELSGYEYCNEPLYSEVPDEQCDCEDSEIGRQCVSDGMAIVTYGWNYGYCGDSYSQSEADANCACDYSEWQDDICIDDGYMRQTRDELSGYEYCDDPLEQNVPNPVCDCNFTEVDRTCIENGYAEVYFEWNFAYCGDSFTEIVEDQSCNCEYDCWTDDICVDDGIMQQVTYEITDFEYCPDEKFRTVDNPACDCESYESGRACIADGTAEVTYTWNYGYCGDDYTETAEDSSCDCEYGEWTDDACIDDGERRQVRYETTDFEYCQDEAYRTVGDPSCECNYTPWVDDECVENGYRRQIRTETSGFIYCNDDLEKVIEDPSCNCEYTCWWDIGCVDEGIMRQERDELSGLPYCNAPLEQDIPSPMCDCEAIELSRECIANVTALVNYLWNYPYCGPDSEEVYDESCWICEPEWNCAEYTECQPDGYQYCTEVHDIHSCGDCYLGDYSEFTEACNYCAIHGPEINAEDQIIVIEGDLVTLDVEVSDPDKDEVLYSISKPVGNDGKWQTQKGDEGTYNVIITATDGVCVAEKVVKVIVNEKPYQSLIVERTAYKEYVRPGELQQLYVTLENMGNIDLEEIKITALVDTLGIWMRTPKFKIMAADEKTKLIEFEIPHDAWPGRHYMRIVISNDNMRRVLYRDFDVI